MFVILMICLGAGAEEYLVRMNIVVVDDEFR